MKKEITVIGKTTEAALEDALAQLGVELSDITYEVVEEAKKGFLGMGATPAKVKVSYTVPPLKTATEFIKTLITNMELSAEINVEENSDGAVISISGENAGILIGHHGDTLDSLQYLTNLAANKKDGENDNRSYTRIVVDIENYRAKREDTLRALARRTAERVRRTRRNVTLEPMTAQERRVIHSEIQGIEGITTFSVGQESNRKVVVALDKKTQA